MEKRIAFWTYWLGVACLVIAVVWRVIRIWVGPADVLGFAPLSLYKGALLLFVAAIATAGYAWTKGQKP